MNSRFVRPETVLLKLAPQPGQTEPDWLLVKKRLNEGERRAMFSRMYLHAGDRGPVVDPQAVGMATVLAYLVDWSFTDPEGKRVVIAEQPENVLEAALNALDPDSFAEIRQAIEAHEDRVKAARAALKNGQDGGSKLPATSPSPFAAAGVTSGSPSSIPTSTTS